MSENLSTTRPIDLEAELQYASSYPAVARWKIHEKFAEPRIGIMDPGRPEETNFGIEGEMIKSLWALGMDGTESLVDIGCGDGRFIKRLKDIGHSGQLVGINRPADTFYLNQFALMDEPKVQFIEGDARKLPIKDESVDIATLNFVLYHIENWQGALAEAERILKPGGKLVIGTREEGHQAELWRFSGLIAKHLEKKLRVGKVTVNSLLGLPAETNGSSARIVAPVSFYSHFDFGTEMRSIPESLRNILQYRQFSESHLGADDWDYYSLAAESLRTSYRVTEGKREHLLARGGLEFRNSIDTVIKPAFFKQVHKKGYFTEYIRQGYDIWEKQAS